jgi:hypothetical protein
LTTFIKKPQIWGLFCILIGFIILKWDALFLPYFWDEAWVYMPAIRTMAEKGPNILPGSIEADLYTGHPLFFYFMASAWIKFWGYSNFVAHSLPLLIAITLLFSMYFVNLSWSKSDNQALLASLLLCIQPNFLTQSSFLLIEVWLCLLFLWSFYFYFKRNWIGFSITIILALWSKESAFCLIPTFGLIAIIERLTLRLNTKELLNRFLGLFILFMVGFSFFIIQKIKLGWFFFPRHANWVSLADFKWKMEISFNSYFVSDARIYIYLAAFLILIIGLFLKIKFHPEQKIILLGTFVFAFIFMVFASINFFSSRYLLGAHSLLLSSAALIIFSIPNKTYQIISFVLIPLFGLNNIDNSLKLNNFSDVDLSYKYLVQAELDMVKYLEEKKYSEKIHAPFLMLVNLTNPYSGFVKEGFTNISSQIESESNTYFIKVPNEPDAKFDSIQVALNLQLEHRTSCNQAWVELYKKTK